MPALTQPGHPGPGDPWVGVEDSDDDPRHPGPNQGIRTRRRTTVMGAGLEGHVDRGAAGGRAGQLEGHGLGVRAARRLRGALGHRLVSRRHDHSPDPRVRGGLGPHGLTQGDRLGHPDGVLGGAAGSLRGGGREGHPGDPGRGEGHRGRLPGTRPLRSANRVCSR